MNGFRNNRGQQFYKNCCFFIIWENQNQRLEYEYLIENLI